MHCQNEDYELHLMQLQTSSLTTSSFRRSSSATISALAVLRNTRLMEDEKKEEVCRERPMTEEIRGLLKLRAEEYHWLNSRYKASIEQLVEEDHVVCCSIFSLSLEELE